jgi:CRISPR-associated protein (TIGR03986 family)
MARFVNPYTFVPHVAEPARDVPAGHSALLEGRFSGVLEVTLTARTPLLIGGFKRKAEDGTETGALPRRRAPAGTVMVPGSGLLGAVRSVHEALAGGCMRVLDLDWTPVHRHPANTRETSYLRLAVVTKADPDTGQAREVALCDKWHWVPARLLPGDDGHPAQAGDQLQYMVAEGKPGEFPAAAVTSAAGRDVVHAKSDAYQGGIVPGSIKRLRSMGPVTENCKVVLVTDTKARDAERGAFFAVGAIGPGAQRRLVSDGTWEKYQKTVDGADDLRPASLKRAGHTDGEEPPYAPDGPEYADVWWPPYEDAESGHSGNGRPVHGRREPHPEQERKVIGKRLTARRYLHVGQPVWVAVSDDEVTEIRLSVLWRYQGDGPVKERVGEARGCTDPSNLCWSCRIFGAADTEGRGENDLAAQSSYRGHVRIGDLLAQGDVQPISWDLAPLASPNPGAGQFYLTHKTGASRQVAGKNERPTATWGSVGDDEDLRPVRGRKFYWRTETEADSERDKQRGKQRKHQSAALSGKVELIPAGTAFSGRIAFDNLDAADYGSLLAALNPRALGETGEDGWKDAVISVGGGKPFGFGSVQIEVTPVQVHGARARYLGQPQPEPSPSQEEAVRAFRARVPPAVRTNWQALAHVLQLGFVKDEDVWYPPGGGTRGDADYDKSFEFFALTNGLQLSKETRPLVLLPDAASGPAAQVIDSPAGRRPRAGGPRAGGQPGER